MPGSSALFLLVGKGTLTAITSDCFTVENFVCVCSCVRVYVANEVEQHVEAAIFGPSTLTQSVVKKKCTVSIYNLSYHPFVVQSCGWHDEIGDHYCLSQNKTRKKIHIMLSHFDPPHHHPFVSWFKVDKFCWGRRRVALISTGLVCFFYGGMGSFFSLYRVGLTNVGIGWVVPSNLTKPSHQTVLIRQAVAELEMSEVFT